MNSNDPKYMICHNARHFCCEDISLIENFDQMMADQIQVWVCHHRCEIDENKSASQLIAEGRYYNVPASELIFMTASDHMSLHSANRSEETKQKISAAISKANKGNKYAVGERSEETKKKMRESWQGKKWWNNGVKQVRAKECPEGYGPGRLKK